MTDTSWVAAAMAQTVPWVRTAGITFGEVTAERVECRLPDSPDLHNHVGGPHAAMIFGLGETASGAVGLAAFSSAMDRVTPLVVRSEISYSRLAELDGGTRPEFTVSVTITDAEGRETTSMTVVWTLRPNR